jgi:pilus assembly protein CpaF
MRPDRILVGEVRGAEVWDMLQAMNTGHEGSMTTIHSNSALDALSRLEMMAAMTGYDLPVHVIRNYVAAAIKLVFHVTRLKGGPRKLVQILEINGVEDGQYRVEEVFGFEQTSIDKRGRAVGHFYASGYRPKILGRIAAYGIELPDDMFDEGKRYPDVAEPHPPVRRIGDQTDATELIIN